MEDIDKLAISFILGMAVMLAIGLMIIPIDSEKTYNTHICNYFGHERAVLIGGSWRCTGNLIAVEGLDQP